MSALADFVAAHGVGQVDEKQVRAIVASALAPVLTSLEGRPQPITVTVQRPDLPKSDGFKRWTEDEVAAFRARLLSVQPARARAESPRARIVFVTPRTSRPWPHRPGCRA
jgi:hypothetical protein